MYDLALISYVIALWHFGSEAVLYRTCGLKGLAGPLIVSSALASSNLPCSVTIEGTLSRREADRFVRATATSLTWMINRAFRLSV